MATEVAARPVARPVPADDPPSLFAVSAGRARSRLTTTPGRLRVASATIVAAVVVVWVVGAGAVVARRSATNQVGLATEPLLVGAQGIYASLADADATAATAFLTGGLEPPALAARYDADIKRAGDQLADVTRQVGSDPASTAAVRTMTDQLPVYTGLVEAARANNRQGFPVGAAYLREASTMMQGQILGAADQLYQVEARRLDRGYRSGASVLDMVGILLAGLLLGVVLLATQAYLMRRTNRVFNVGVVAATVLALVLVVWVSTAFVVEHHHLATARRRGSDPVKVMAQARILALRAQSDESLTLIARGTGQKYSDDFKSVMTQLGGSKQDGTGGLLGQATQGAGSPDDTGRAVTAFTATVRTHAQVAGLADIGDFNGAVALATGQESSDFTQLNGALDTAVNDNQQAFVREASAARSDFGWLALGLIVLAGAIALLALYGIQQRINDYR